MLKRLICLVILLVFCFSFARAEETATSAQRYDLDLTFSLDPEALPARSRSRARGYAELLDCLRLSGDITICEETQSFDLNATLYFRNNPEVSIPFRFYGIPEMLFWTSPIIGDQTVLFNMPALAEFSIKIGKSLDTPLPSFALLYPVVYEYNFWTTMEAWNKYTGPSGESRRISAKQIAKLADAWTELLNTDPNLNVWMTALLTVASAPEAAEAELNNVPAYLRDYVAAGKALTVKIGKGTETWKNADGQTLFSRQETDQSLAWSFTLPADENSYVPLLSFSRTNDESGISFTVDGSLLRESVIALPPGIDLEGYSPVTGSDDEDESDYGGGEDSPWPKTMIRLSASGESIPVSLPCDSSFTLSAAIKGALYPNFDLTVLGETKEDGSVSVSLCQAQEETEPVPFLTCEGTVIPAAAETVPDFNYKPDELGGNFNFFSFSEYYMELFKQAVTKPLIKGLLDFVAEAPTAACQSILDDLTDSGILNMMMSGQ